jgi:hypothetical protein
MQLLKDIWLLVRCYPIAKGQVLAVSVEAKATGLSYTGPTRTQIAYNKIRTDLVKKGWKDDNITGAVIYIAVSLAYLCNKS